MPIRSFVWELKAPKTVHNYIKMEAKRNNKELKRLIDSIQCEIAEYRFAKKQGE